MILISSGKAYRLNEQGQIEQSALLSHGVSAEEWEPVKEVSENTEKRIKEYFGVTLVKEE